MGFGFCFASCTGEPPKEELPPPFIGPGNFLIHVECGQANEARSKLRVITIAIEEPVRGDGTVIFRESSEEGKPPVLDTAVAYTLSSVRMNEIYRLVQHQKFFELPRSLIGPSQERYCTIRVRSDRKDHTVHQSNKISHPFNEVCLGLNQFLPSGCEIMAPELDVLRPLPKRAVFSAEIAKRVNLPLAIRLYERDDRDPEIEPKPETAYCLSVLYRRAGDTEKAWHYARACKERGRDDYYFELARQLEGPRPKRASSNQ